MRSKKTERETLMKRRDFIAGLGGLSTLALTGQNVRAQEAWPNRNITMVVPFPAGGQADIAARPIAASLQKMLGKPVIIDNRSGAGGSLGNAAVARAQPDGHTLLMTLSSLAVLPESDRIYDRPPAYEVDQLQPIARVLADPTLFAVPASAPWKTIADFIADAKARPGAIAFGSSGPFGTLHIAMEMFANAADIKLLHVPYRGATPAISDLLGGQIQALASAPGTLKQHVDAGTLRVLANWGSERLPAFPNLPTFKELGFPEVEFYIWAGLFVPKGLPQPIVTKLRDCTRQAMSDSEVTRTFEVAGNMPAYQDADEFAQFVAKDSARLVAVAKKIGKV
ncbi:tripartite-type tricarboxylate transporter receptor subunit TctC [Nitrobacteraceae bacterium AZCC 2146]